MRTSDVKFEALILLVSILGKVVLMYLANMYQNKCCNCFKEGCFIHDFLLKSGNYETWLTKLSVYTVNVMKCFDLVSTRKQLLAEYKTQ